MSSSDSFVGAVRAALSGADTVDMRRVAAEALSLLGDDQIYQAALTHLASLARREWNKALREGGVEGVDSDEVVNLRGTDLRLGDTTDDDREWLASNREALARGLEASADRLREAPIVGAVSGHISTREVIHAERVATEVENLVATCRRLVDGLGTGSSLAERRSRDGIAEIRAKIAAAEADIERFTAWAERVAATIEIPSLHRQLQRAIQRVADLVTQEVAA